MASLLKHYDPPLPRSSRSQSVRDLWNLQLNPNSPLLTLEIGEKLSLSEALDIFFLVKKLNEQHFLCDLIVIASTSGQERTFQPFVKNNRFLRVLQNKNINDSLQKALQTSSDLYLDRTIPNYQNLSLSPSIEPTFPDKLILKQPPYKFSGDDFIFEINTGTQPRRPWVNILANHQFGTLIHHSGQSYTWYKNSTELSITKADRDLYNFQGGEGMFLQQGENLISLFQVEKTNVLYNPNKSTFETTINQCRYRQSITIDNKEPAKLVSLEITNNSSEIKEITIAHRWNLALGNGDPDISVSHTNDYRRTTIINHTHQDFSQIINCVVETNHVVTADFYHDQLIKKVSIILEPGKTTTFNFLTFINDFDYSRFKSLEAPIKNLIIDTPDNYQDNLFNTWLLPQSLHSRLFGRLGFYQPSGAYGFRDQLQDVMALVYSDPALMREHIIRSAGWVTENGNAFNWWYESSNFGSIRRFTDHQIWLLIAVADYVEKTSDIDILDTEVGFKIIPIELDFIDKKNWVGIPEQSATTRSLASLITIIINFCLDNIGEHGLLKHGQSDWNDGFNNVGQQGRGESIWSTMAFTRSLKALLPLAEYLEQTTTDELEKHIKSLEAAIEKNGKGEKYYYRSYDDNGQILGQPNSHLSIASLTQSWATLGNIGDQSFNNQALQIAFNELVTTDYILLYKTNSKIPKIDLGYIQDYPIGTREHLAQYNHAALWFAQALLKAGFNNQGYQLLNLINPAYLSEKRGFNYGAEPYAVTADIFGPDSPKAGSAGWSWYTGSAGVYYVTLVEYLFGIKYSKLGDQITIKPSFPSYWNQASITIYNLTLNFVRDSNLEFNTLHTSEPSFNNATSTISISGLTTGQIINFTFN